VTDPSRSDILRLPALERTREPRRALISAYAVVRALSIAVAVASCAWMLVVGVQRWGFVRVPSLVGEPVADARETLQRLGLSPDVVQERYSSEQPGVVLEQLPAPSVRVRRATEVRLIVSGGVQGIAIPDITGVSETTAREKLEYLGLQLRIVNEPSEAEPGTVISTTPAAGTIALAGETVTVYISSKENLATLVDYSLKGKKVAIYPVYSSAYAGTDLTLEIARRLSSLVQAAGASAKVTRSYSEKSVSAATSVARARAAGAQVYVQIDLESDETTGMVVASPTRKDATLGQYAFRALQSQLGGVGYATKSLSSPVSAGKSVRLILGNAQTANSQITFGDTQWRDKVARALYTAVGQYLTK
jgi:hypothetical protein